MSKNSRFFPILKGIQVQHSFVEQKKKEIVEVNIVIQRLDCDVN